MQMRKNLVDIVNVLRNDEILLRLLHYYPEDFLDNPLDPAKPNILSLPDNPRVGIINDVIKNTFKVHDLDQTRKCRLCVYPSRRNNTGNYLVSAQNFSFDTYVHSDYDDIDQRLSQINDRISEIIFNTSATGIWKIDYKDGDRIIAPPEYIGYKLIYTVGSVN